MNFDDIPVPMAERKQMANSVRWYAVGRIEAGQSVKNGRIEAEQSVKTGRIEEVQSVKEGHFKAEQSIKDGPFEAEHSIFSVTFIICSFSIMEVKRLSRDQRLLPL